MYENTAVYALYLGTIHLRCIWWNWIEVTCCPALSCIMSTALLFFFFGSTKNHERSLYAIKGRVWTFQNKKGGVWPLCTQLLWLVRKVSNRFHLRVRRPVKTCSKLLLLTRSNACLPWSLLHSKGHTKVPYSTRQRSVMRDSHLKCITRGSRTIHGLFTHGFTRG